MSTRRTDRYTLSAAYALVLIICYFGLKSDPLGIVTPHALQGTALEKYGRAYSVTIVNGKAFYFENFCFHKSLLWRSNIFFFFKMRFSLCREIIFYLSVIGRSFKYGIHTAFSEIDTERFAKHMNGNLTERY